MRIENDESGNENTLTVANSPAQEMNKEIKKRKKSGRNNINA
jgi:hypothetical protein